MPGQQAQIVHSALKAQNLLSSEGRQSVADLAFALSCVRADELRANSVQKTDFVRSGGASISDPTDRGQATDRGEQRFAEPLYGVNPYRGFESLPLRH